MKSSKIGDASFIGLDCPTGDVSDCNDGTLESAPSECKGVLILSKEESQCGSKCYVGPNERSTSNENRQKWWTLYTRRAPENIIELTYTVCDIRYVSNVLKTQSQTWDKICGITSQTKQDEIQSPFLENNDIAGLKQVFSV